MSRIPFPGKDNGFWLLSRCIRLTVCDVTQIGAKIYFFLMLLDMNNNSETFFKALNELMKLIRNLFEKKNSKTL